MPPPRYVWLNGAILPEQEARIPPTDPGFLVGDGVFETLAARDGRLVGAHEHWLRLAQSCETLALPILPELVFIQAIKEVIQANSLPTARVRVTVTRGTGSWEAPSPTLESATICVSATPLKPWPPTEKVCFAPWVRNERGALAGIKSIAYAENLRCLAYAKTHGCGEALVANTDGDLCEGTGSNVFIVVEGVLMTPPLTSGCLPGVTRELVLKACQQAGIECLEKAIPLSLLQGCQEAFLTSSTRDIHPISELEGRGLESPGPVTARLSMLTFPSSRSTTPGR